MAVYAVKLLQGKEHTFHTFVTAQTDHWAEIYGKELANEYKLFVAASEKVHAQGNSLNLDQQYEIARNAEYSHGLDILLVMIAHLQGSMYEGIQDQIVEARRVARLSKNKKTASKWWAEK